MSQSTPQQYPQFQPGVPQNVQYLTPTVQPQILYQQAPTRKWDKYNRKASKILGSIQIIAGFLCIIFNAVAISIYRKNNNVYGGFLSIGPGIWGAVFFFVSGGLALGAAQEKSTGLIVGSLVMNIFSAVMAGLLLIMSAVDINFNVYYHRSYSALQQTDVAMIACLMVISILLMTVTIVSSGFACASACCGGSANTSTPGVAFIMTPQTTGTVMQTGASQPGQASTYEPLRSRTR